MSRRRRPRRTPVIRQLNQVECGAACLAMLLAYHGRSGGLAAVRERCRIGRDGVTARTILHVGRSFGLSMAALSGEPAALARLPLPAIVHWEFNHFVVVERWTPRSVAIVDPAVGRRRLTPAEFEAGFTGVVLTGTPGPTFAAGRAASRPASWRPYLGAALRPARGLLAEILAASALVQILGLTLPLMTELLVDRVLPLRLTGVMPLIGLGLGLMLLVQFAIALLRSALMLRLRARVDARLMIDFVQHVLALPLRFFQVRHSGDLIMRLGGAALVREILTGQTLSLLLDSVLVVGYLAILMARDAGFGVLVLAAGAAQALVVLATAGRLHERLQRQLMAESASQSYLVEALNGIGTLKASGAEGGALERWSALLRASLDQSIGRDQVAAVTDAALAALRAGATLLLLWVGVQRVLDGTMTLGMMLGLQALAAATLAPLATVVAGGQRLGLVGAHLERIGDVLDAEREQAPGARPAPTLRGRIELEEVDFAYDADGGGALRGISVTIEAGQKVALVGATGSGKTTLARLLLGLYRPTAGAIRFDGIPLAELDLRGVRRQFGAVLQESFLFAGSIRQNIAFNAPDLSLDEVVEAARRAAIHDDILAMPMGYETLVGEGGAGLSGGQRQRLAIARAIARRPAVLVLDEATSHLDSVTERVVAERLSALACTRIVIAHRLSTVRDADLILVIDGGRIVERGTHRDLMARDGRYAALIREQAGSVEGSVGPAVAGVAR
jgi:ABC-type bacteriocin/lantibiotic exporter with double-glycine peptidase domain